MKGPRVHRVRHRAPELRAPAAEPAGFLKRRFLPARGAVGRANHEPALHHLADQRTGRSAPCGAGCAGLAAGGACRARGGCANGLPGFVIRRLTALFDLPGHRLPGHAGRGQENLRCRMEREVSERAHEGKYCPRTGTAAPSRSAPGDAMGTSSRALLCVALALAAGPGLQPAGARRPERRRRLATPARATSLDPAEPGVDWRVGDRVPSRCRPSRGRGRARSWSRSSCSAGHANIELPGPATANGKAEKHTAAPVRIVETMHMHAALGGRTLNRARPCRGPRLMKSILPMRVTRSQGARDGASAAACTPRSSRSRSSRQGARPPAARSRSCRRTGDAHARRRGDDASHAARDPRTTTCCNHALRVVGPPPLLRPERDPRRTHRRSRGGALATDTWTRTVGT